MSVTEHFDLYQVSSELEKLAAYASGRSITASDIAELTNKTVSGDPFGIMDAVSAKNRGAVFSAVDRFLGAGQDVINQIGGGWHQVKVIAREYSNGEGLLGNDRPLRDLAG